MNNRKLTPGGAVAAPIPWYLAGGVSAANCVGAYQAIGAADQASSYTNLANPGTYTLTTAAAPTWDIATGWKGNGTSQYLQTGVAISTTNFSFIMRFSGGSNRSQAHGLAGNYAFGFYHGNNQTYLFNSGGAGVATGVIIASGILCITPTDGYRDGVDIGNTVATSSPNTTLPLLAMYNNSSYSNFADFYIQAAAIYNAALTPAQVVAITAGMAALTESTPPF